MLDAWADWIRWPSWTEVAIGLGLFVALAGLSALLTGWVVVRLPANYFVGRHPPPLWDGKHPALRLTAKVVKNLLGVVLVAVGIVLSLPGVPGQGLLTILLGLMLLDAPGKRRAEQWLASRPPLRRGMNALRRRYGRPPLVVETEAVSGEPEATFEGSPPAPRSPTSHSG